MPVVVPKPVYRPSITPITWSTKSISSGLGKSLTETVPPRIRSADGKGEA